MKQIIVISLLSALIFSIECSCSKELTTVKQQPITSINVVNAVVNSNPLISDFSGSQFVNTYYSTSSQVGYASFSEYSVNTINIPVVIYQITDTVRPFFKGAIMVNPYNIYSLFLSASDTNSKSIDTLFTIDNPPNHNDKDSVTGIRFVNLSPNSSPLSINIEGNANGSVVDKISYRNITSFTNYPATTNIPQYTFEIRNAESGELLTTMTYNISPFQNITIVINGKVGGIDNGALATFVVPNY